MPEYIATSQRKNILHIKTLPIKANPFASRYLTSRNPFRPPRLLLGRAPGEGVRARLRRLDSVSTSGPQKNTYLKAVNLRFPALVELCSTQGARRSQCLTPVIPFLKEPSLRFL